MGILKYCLICNKEFFVKPYRELIAKYCSHKCYSESKVGNVPQNSGQFKKGHKLGLGRKRPDMLGNQYGKGKIPWNKNLIYSNKKRIELLKNGEYKTLHIKINHLFGTPNFCERCGSKSKPRYHWANKTGNYLLNRDDWLRLCVSCHYKYDGSQKYGASLYRR